jgi:hypothetical protein
LVSVRTCLLVILVGSIIFWVGMPFPVGGDYFGAENDAERIVVVDENRVQIGISFGLFGLGAAIAGVGLWMLGRAIAPMEEAERGRRRKTAAQVAAWLGLLGALGGLSRLSSAVFASPETFVQGNFGAAIGLVGMAATAVSVVVLGVLAWSAPPRRWTAVVLVLGGVVGAGTLLPLFWYFALIVFAVANLRMMRRAVDSDVDSPAIAP